MRYKCLDCYTYVDENPCPLCGSDNVEICCICDHTCICLEDVHEGIRFCMICGKPICPCGSSDSVALSRITGYYSNLSGYNAGKKQEIKDRHRYSNIT